MKTEKIICTCIVCAVILSYEFGQQCVRFLPSQDNTLNIFGLDPHCTVKQNHVGLPEEPIFPIGNSANMYSVIATGTVTSGTSPSTVIQNDMTYVVLPEQAKK